LTITLTTDSSDILNVFEINATSKVIFFKFVITINNNCV
jgi:hypothetical protein